VIALGDRWNTRVIVTPGAPLVTRGPYRWMRHPNYLAVVIEIAAVPMIRGCWMTAVTFSIANALMLSVRIPIEERALESLPH
jgi:methyltransferase